MNAALGCDILVWVVGLVRRKVVRGYQTYWVSLWGILLVLCEGVTVPPDMPVVCLECAARGLAIVYVNAMMSYESMEQLVLTGVLTNTTDHQMTGDERTA